MSELNEATQILEVSVRTGEDVVKVAAKVGKMSAKLLKLLFMTLCKAILQEYRQKGQVRSGTINRYAKLHGEELQCFRFPEDRMKEVQDYLKAHNVLYCVLPDLNLKDGMKEIMFPASATARVNAMIDALKIGEVISYDEYEHNAEPGAVDRETEKVKEEVKDLNGREEEPSPKKKDAMKEFEKNADYQHRSHTQDGRTKEITINESLIVGETETHYITRIPGSRKRRAEGLPEYMPVAKKDAVWIDDGKTLSVHLDMSKEYPLCDKAGNHLPEMDQSGKELYQHYDPVKRNTRQQDGQKKEQKKSADKKKPAPEKKVSK